jgi:microcystin-dependent protein
MNDRYTKKPTNQRPYIEKQPGDLLLAEDWNTMQVAIRRDVEQRNGIGVPTGAIMLWSGRTGKKNVPPGWALCDGSQGTPDLRDRFIVGSGGRYTPGEQGGRNEVRLEQEHLPIHSHSFTTEPAEQRSSEIGTTEKKQRQIGYAECQHYAAETREEESWSPSEQENRADNHSHSGRTDAAGQHAPEPVDIRPKYYALAYIMKISSRAEQSC